MNITKAFGGGLAAAIALAAMAQAATPTTSEHSANSILPGCRFLVAPKPATITSDVSGWSVGLCSGTIDGILTVAFNNEWRWSRVTAKQKMFRSVVRREQQEMKQFAWSFATLMNIPT